MLEQKPVVFLLDDEESVLTALSRVLEGDGLNVQAWTSAVRFLEEHDPDTPGCLVADVRMPEMSGLELQRALVSRGVARPIVFVTGIGDILSAVQAMKAGAVTFLAKPIRREALLPAVREALEKDVIDRAHDHERRGILNRLASLTPRERQVLNLVVTGMLNKQIAAALGAAEKTIKVHRGRIMDKMEVRTAVALVGLLSRADPSREIEVQSKGMRPGAWAPRAVQPQSLRP